VIAVVTSFVEVSELRRILAKERDKLLRLATRSSLLNSSHVGQGDMDVKIPDRIKVVVL